MVNNAAVINPNAPLWRVPAAEFDRVVDITFLLGLSARDNGRPLTVT